MDLSVPLATIRTPNFVSRWYLPHEIDIFLDSALPGDALEFSRGYYKHWGIYIGRIGLDVDLKNGVVHAFIPGDKFLLPLSNLRVTSRFKKPLDPNQAYVDASELSDVLGNDKVRINNSTDANSPAFDPEEIIDKAIKAIGFYQEYDMLKNNCEHFVNICRRGIQSSEQVDNALLWGKLGGILAAMAAIGIAILKR